jgi:hypothetical protein
MTDDVIIQTEATPQEQGSAVAEALNQKSDAEIATLLSSPESVKVLEKEVVTSLDTGEEGDDELNTALDAEAEAAKKAAEEAGKLAAKAADEVGDEGEGKAAEDLDKVIVPEAELHKQVFDELFKPFKANGKEIKIDSVDEARKLMQQGANYHKNMEEFRPFKKAMSVLKQRNALDPEKLNFLLDVQEGKPEAIAKLLKDINVEPLDIDLRKSEEYKSGYEDNEPLEALNTVLDSLEDGDHKVKTLTVLSSNGWDAESRKVLFKNPEGIKIVNEQIRNGQFEKIMAVVEKRKLLGTLTGVSDLEAYNAVGLELAKQGKLGIPKSPSDSKSTVSTTSTGKPATDLMDKRKKAAGAPRAAPSNTTEQSTFNPMTATDEEVDQFLANLHKKAAGS